ncbi:hypothetical protein R3P38DRAFT_3342516 [Favolaschia claudopus]|uniref:Uncharacterized protein n=1 Tax=Favolaschia claudopus TaxID=2862362 RepID=A0AAW0DV48_9AGAR
MADKSKPSANSRKQILTVQRRRPGKEGVNSCLFPSPSFFEVLHPLGFSDSDSPNAVQKLEGLAVRHKIRWKVCHGYGKWVLALAEANSAAKKALGYCDVSWEFQLRKHFTGNATLIWLKILSQLVQESQESHFNHFPTSACFNFNTFRLYRITADFQPVHLAWNLSRITELSFVKLVGPTYFFPNLALDARLQRDAHRNLYRSPRFNLRSATLNLFNCQMHISTLSAPILRFALNLELWQNLPNEAALLCRVFELRLLTLSNDLRRKQVVFKTISFKFYLLTTYMKDVRVERRSRQPSRVQYGRRNAGGSAAAASVSSEWFGGGTGDADREGGGGTSTMGSASRQWMGWTCRWVKRRADELEFQRGEERELTASVSRGPKASGGGGFGEFELRRRSASEESGIWDSESGKRLAGGDMGGEVRCLSGVKNGCGELSVVGVERGESYEKPRERVGSAGVERNRR